MQFVLFYLNLWSGVEISYEEDSVASLWSDAAVIEKNMGPVLRMLYAPQKASERKRSLQEYCGVLSQLSLVVLVVASAQQQGRQDRHH